MPRALPAGEVGATVGVALNAQFAVLVTLAPGAALLDRSRVELTAQGLPSHPHHHEGSWAVGRYLGTPGARALTLAEAVSLVEQVRASAERGAHEALSALAAALEMPIVRLAVRAYPPLPPTIEARIADHRAQTFADAVLYRDALAHAAQARAWAVFTYAPADVFAQAAATLGVPDAAPHLRAMGERVGAPWQAIHKLAAAGALAAMGARGGDALGRAIRPTSRP